MGLCYFEFRVRFLHTKVHILNSASTVYKKTCHFNVEIKYKILYSGFKIISVQTKLHFIFF